MVCPNCLKEVNDNLTCPNCGISLSHVEDGANIEGKLSSAANSYNKLKALILLPIVAVILVFMLALSFGGLKTYMILIGIIFNFEIISKICLVVGLVSLVIAIILYIKKIKKGLFKLFIVLSSLGLGLSLLTYYGIGNIMKSTDTKLASANYVMLNKEKIPTMKSVVGYIPVMVSDTKENYRDKEVGQNITLSYIMYTNLTEDNINKYTKELENLGYIRKEIVVNNEENIIYTKNSGTKSIFISITGNNIIYALYDGSYETILNILEGDN